jgi:hypothetical protein
VEEEGGRGRWKRKVEEGGRGRRKRKAEEEGGGGRMPSANFCVVDFGIKCEHVLSCFFVI